MDNQSADAHDATHHGQHHTETSPQIHSRRTNHLGHRSQTAQRHQERFVRTRSKGVHIAAPTEAAKPQPAPRPHTGHTMDIAPPQAHPLVGRAQHRTVGNPRRGASSVITRDRRPYPQAAASQQSAVKPRHTPASVLKQQAIAKALHDAPSHHTKPHQDRTAPKLRTRKAQLGRAMSIAGASLGLLLLGGYFTYLYMPNISVRVAAVQSGVNATYPSYQPTGYSLDGPVAYTNNEVKLRFAANAGPQTFAITQTKSNWDSSAVLENYVKPEVGNSYVTTRDNGLTVYTFDSKAAWVSNGTFYTIDGDAPLTNEQVRRIATSM